MTGLETPRSWIKPTQDIVLAAAPEFDRKNMFLHLFCTTLIHKLFITKTQQILLAMKAEAHYLVVRVGRSPRCCANNK